MHVLLTFADTRMRQSLARIAKQAVATHKFDRIHTFTEGNLDRAFRHRHAAVLKSGVRGFGYWCWKPQILLQVLGTLNEGDILLYLDAGCHLNPNGSERLREYFAMASSAPAGVVAFQAGRPIWGGLAHPSQYRTDLRDGCWIKGDLLDHLGVRQREDLLQSSTITAGVLFIRKCQSSVALISDWLAVMEHDFSLVDDSPSRSPNLPQFIEHRHDQAIFSILAKQRGVETVSMFEYWYPNAEGASPDWSKLDRFPIHARRDKAVRRSPTQRLRQAVVRIVSRAAHRFSQLAG